MKVGDRVRVKDACVGKNYRNTDMDGGFGTIGGVSNLFDWKVGLETGANYSYDGLELELVEPITHEPFIYNGKKITQLKELSEIDWITINGNTFENLESIGVVKIEDIKPELKPCPFCGGEATIERDMETDHMVKCEACSITLYRSTECYEEASCRGDRQDAIDAWNKRV